MFIEPMLSAQRLIYVIGVFQALHPELVLAGNSLDELAKFPPHECHGGGCQGTVPLSWICRRKAAANSVKTCFCCAARLVVSPGSVPT